MNIVNQHLPNLKLAGFLCPVGLCFSAILTARRLSQIASRAALDANAVSQQLTEKAKEALVSVVVAVLGLLWPAAMGEQSKGKMWGRMWSLY
jgi:hypothetical protein